jgi:hypothetical protein
MHRSILLAAAFAALAAPAIAATEVTVNLHGLSGKAAHEAIRNAAETACHKELDGSTDLVRFYNQSDCVSAAVARAEFQLSPAHAALASNQDLRVEGALSR